MTVPPDTESPRQPLSDRPPSLDLRQLSSQASQKWRSTRRSVTFKLFSMIFLLLFSMIPVAFIQDLVHSRQRLQNEVSEETSQKWASAQTLTGPVLSLPYRKTVITEIDDPDKKNQRIKKAYTTTEYLHVLPAALKINGNMATESLKRGIYEMMVYTSELKLEGHFEADQFQNLPVPPQDIFWDQAFVSMGISDLRGIAEKIQLKWGKQSGLFDPGTVTEHLFKSGVHRPVKLQKDQGATPFSLALKLKGNQQLYFVPVGKETNVQLSANWGSPSFDGAFLPERREIKEKSFRADWKVLHLNRNYPQLWQGAQYDFSGSAFGVFLIQPVDHYLKVDRVVKYALFFIGLTFMTFFFVEVLTQRMVHPLQYLLVGFALCVFYTLLLSISEHLGFEAAYAIAASMTIVLITTYAAGFLKSLPLTAVTGGVLLSLYSFIYVIIYQEDYALLMGSLGLFVVLALVMFFSRKLDFNAEPGNTIESKS